MHQLSEKFAKVRAQGLIRTLEVQFNRFVPPFVFRYSKGDIYEFDIEKLKRLAHALPVDNNLQFVRLTGTPNDPTWNRLREFTWNSVPNETTLNDLGYAIVDRRDPQQFLGGLWAGLNSFSENNLGIEFKFSHTQAWLYCAFVDDNARGRGIYKRLISFVAADLERQGYQQLLGIVQPWNKISRAMHEKNSLGILGRMSALRLGSFVQVWNSGDIAVSKSFVSKPATHPCFVTIC